MKRLLAVAMMLILPSFCSAGEESGTLYTRDRVPIAYEQVKNGHDSVVIVCPGFFNSKSNRWMQAAADMLSPEYDVMLFDFRGHGKSGGTFSWSSKEYMDLEAVVDYVAGQGYKNIDILAFSLGAVAAIDVASKRSDINSMVLISAPSGFGMINFHFWEPAMLSDLKDNIDCKWEGKGARCGWMFSPKPDPMADISKIGMTRILFVHGEKDWVIKPKHSVKLYGAAPAPKRLEVIKGGLHAERLLQQYPERMERLILEWFRGKSEG